MRNNRGVIIILLVVWFVHQYITQIQAQADNVNTSFSNGKLNFSNHVPQSQEVPLSNHHDVKVVLSEEQNQHCFKTSILGPGESDGDLFKRYCFPGYRRSGKSETCSGPHGCCHCAEGTYMPQPNDCGHCIMKTFCHDFGLEYVDFGSSSNNSKCEAQTQTQPDYHTNPSTSSLVAAPTRLTTGILPSHITKVQNTTNCKAGFSGTEYWMFVAVILAGGLLLLFIGFICNVCFCKGDRGIRKLVSPYYGMNMSELQQQDCSSEGDRLSDDTCEATTNEI